MSLCKYQDMFGKPGTGAHSKRLFGVAIVDVIFTVIGAYIFARIFKTKFIKMLIILFIIGIIAHRLFCVRTTIDKLIFQ
jgi:hypothetical protein